MAGGTPLPARNHAPDRDHAEKAGISAVRGGEARGGDHLILDQLGLDENEKETLEHIMVQMEAERGGSTVPQPLRICGLPLSKRSVLRRS